MILVQLHESRWTAIESEITRSVVQCLRVFSFAAKKKKTVHKSIFFFCWSAICASENVFTPAMDDNDDVK